MAGIGHRAKLYQDIISFPATKSATAVTLTSSELYPFEASGYGGANIVLSGDTVSGDTITFKTYVSFDAGTNWIQVDQDDDVHNATLGETGSSSRRFFVPIAPRVKVEAVFSAAATLGAGHALNIDAEFVEYEPEAARTVFEDVVSFGDSLAEEVFATTVNGDTLLVNNPSKLYIWFGAADRSVIGDSAAGNTVNLQGSTDTTTWWTIQTLSTAIPQSGDSDYDNLYEVIERQDFPKYVRLQYIGDTDNYYYSGHGMKYYVISME